MTKAIITTTNSLWGVIINPHSANEYRHIINFKNDSVKTDFINNNLFGGKNYKDLLDNAPEVSISIIDSTKAFFRVNPADYPNEDTLSLLNKDFAIIRHNGKELFYTLTSKMHGSVIEYSCDLDIFFTYNIKNMFNDKPAEISRAMSDRYVIRNGINNKKVIKGKHIVDQLSRHKNENIDPIFLPEEIDGFSSNCLLPSGEIDQFLFDYTPYIDPSLTTSRIKEINIAINNLTFQKVVLTNKSNGNPPDGIGAKFYYTDSKDPKYNCGTEEFISNTSYVKTNKNVPQGFDNNDVIESGVMTLVGVANSYKYNHQPVEVYIVAGGNEPVLKIDYIKNPPTDCTKILKLGAATLVSDNPNVVDGSLSPLPGSFLADLISKSSYITIGHKSSTDPNIVVMIRINGLPSSNGTYVAQTDKKSQYFNTNWGLIGLSSVYINDHEYTSKTVPFSKDIFNVDNNNKKDFERDSIFNPKYELKSHGSPYKIFKVGSSTENKFDIKPQLFTSNDPIKCKIADNHMIENWGYVLYLKHYKNVFMKSDYVNPEANIHFEDRANYSMLTTQDGFKEFMSRNKAQQNQSLNNKALTAAGGVGGALLGGIAGVATGSPIAAIGSVFSGITGLFSSINSVKQQFAMQDDLLSSPERLSNSGTTLIKDFLQKDMKTHLQEYKINPFMQRVVAEHFHMYGYNYSGKLFNINDLIHTRVTFNYLKVSGSFENCKLQASADIKQMINDTLESGVHIWHCDDSNFKGIKNYNSANVENNIIKVIESGLL